MNQQPKVVALIPAHDEEKNITEAVKHLQDQTIGCNVIVVCDNCKDNTKNIAESLGASIFESAKNIHRKSGALNQVLSQVLDKYDIILVQDADTTIASDVIEIGLEELGKDSKLGAICSKAGVKDIHPKSMREELWWRLQRIEYATFDTSRVETRGAIKVIHGMAAMYRSKALLDVKRKWGRIYDEHNITEDYELTVCLKELGWKVTACLEMKAFTKVPTTFKELWIQRVRWFRGGVDVLRTHGLNRVTGYEYVQHLLFAILTMINVTIIAGVSYAIYSGQGLQIQPLFYAVIAITTIDGLYRLRYVENLRLKEILIRLLVFPFSLYMLIYQAEQLWAYWLSFRKSNQRW